QMRKLLLFLSLLIPSLAWFYGRSRPDAWTQGGVWPLPQYMEYGKVNRTISPQRMFINAGSHEDCDIVQDNVRGYVERWLFPFPVSADSSSSPYHLSILIEQKCPMGAPQQGMNESYSLKVSSEKAVLEAAEVWGAIRGLETFSQLIFFDQNENTYKLRTAVIDDWPRFSVRGILIDTSRHFLSVKTIKKQLDIMAANKMNVLHWHIVDSESFPYESQRFPHLSKKGAYSPRHVYTRAMVEDVIEYARMRAIRVMPEFDTPGHTSSWNSQPGLLTECFDSNGENTNLPNLIDPTNEDNFKFLGEFFEEVVSTFPEKFLHLGGDEISDYLEECWNRNKKIRKFMRKRGMTNTTQLEDYYFKKLENVTSGLHEQRDRVFWQEVFDLDKPSSSSIIHIWKGNTFAELAENIRQATMKGHRVIVSSCWYLNYVKYGADWKNFVAGTVETNSRYYYCDPHDFIGTREQKKLVLGGVATMWGEMIDNTNIEAVLWPRASAVAERLWSRREDTNDAEEAWPRLHELRCRMVARGYRFAPTNWPDYCPFELNE
ncbi:hypothetical protein PMAYCL1PPCAC_02673, partial [Pristionchus mayeri]